MPGHFIEAGLPNIVGRIDTDGAGALDLHQRPTKGNAFYSEQIPNLTSFWGTKEYLYRGIIMDASLCSEIYGKSITVQPASYTVYFIVRIY